MSTETELFLQYVRDTKGCGIQDLLTFDKLSDIGDQTLEDKIMMDILNAVQNHNNFNKRTAFILGFKIKNLVDEYIKYKLNKMLGI